MNGMALHGGFTPYGATFLVFSDYMRPAVRMAALMNQPVIYIWTHDSIFLGEDGPTHQPIEHLTALRAIPNLFVIRPGDPAEVPYAWEIAVRRKDGPTALILTRQGLPTLDRKGENMAAAAELRRGGYILAESSNGQPQAILLCSGSEVACTLAARQLLEEEGIPVRVVAMPCMELFKAQDAAYREKVLPKTVRTRIAVEAASRMSWEGFLGLDGASVTIDNRFGASAPANILADKFGFTPENIVKVTKQAL